jgi:hypothetical protein
MAVLLRATGPAPTPRALAGCGKRPSGAPLDLAPVNFQGFPPPGESHRSYTSLTTAITPCAVQTPLCPVRYARTERVQCVNPQTKCLLMWGRYSCIDTSPPHIHIFISIKMKICIIPCQFLQLRYERNYLKSVNFYNKWLLFNRHIFISMYLKLMALL